VAANQHPSVQRLAILEAIEAKHKKEVEALREKKLASTTEWQPRDPEILDLLVQRQISRRTEELQEAIRFLRREIAAAQEGIARYGDSTVFS